MGNSCTAEKEPTSDWYIWGCYGGSEDPFIHLKQNNNGTSISALDTAINTQNDNQSKKVKQNKNNKMR